MNTSYWMSMIKTFASLIMVVLTFTSCNTSEVNYKIMSDEEIYDYNLTVAGLDQIYCVRQVRV